jgi:hypothetical protein
VSVLKSAPYLYVDSRDSQFDTRTSFAPFLAPVTPYVSPLFTSLTSVPTPLCFDASFLAYRPNTVLTTHALGAGGLRDERGGSYHNCRDRKAVEKSHLKLLFYKHKSSRLELVPGACPSEPKIGAVRQPVLLLLVEEVTAKNLGRKVRIGSTCSASPKWP